ncbi:SRPBCC family protein [Rossellomorea vietnamensis]|uniref:SRPBCC family protein n=1 Tax=Rossellomorea vietnamensis TaxID=218284 RepID=UPI003D2664C5
MTIHEELTFKATADQMYKTLTDSSQFSEMTGGAPTDIQAEEGGSFSLFGGMITGRNIELVPGKRVVQAWRAVNWDEGVYSLVNFEWKQQENGTQLVFDHVGFPEGQGEHLTAGWHENYWKNLKKFFGEE